MRRAVGKVARAPVGAAPLLPFGVVCAGADVVLRARSALWKRGGWVGTSKRRRRIGEGGGAWMSCPCSSKSIVMVGECLSISRLRIISSCPSSCGRAARYFRGCGRELAGLCTCELTGTAETIALVFGSAPSDSTSLIGLYVRSKVAAVPPGNKVLRQ